MEGTRTLLLNASYEPLRVVSWQRAVTMLLLEKVEVLENYDNVLRAATFRLHVPAVIRLRSYIKRHKLRAALSRRNIFFRDGYKCQYCKKRFPSVELTCDHVIPRSQGGLSSWENLVAACGPCNRRKGGRTPSEARMKLSKSPLKPTSLPIEYILNVSRDNHPTLWSQYLAWSPTVELVA